MSTVTIQAFDSTTVVYSGYMTKAPPIEPSKKTLKVSGRGGKERERGEQGVKRMGKREREWRKGEGLGGDRE